MLMDHLFTQDLGLAYFILKKLATEHRWVYDDTKKTPLMIHGCVI